MLDTMSDTGLMPPSPETALSDPAEADNVIYNPSREELRTFSRELETTTEFGSPAYVSEQRSRCADRTKNAIDDEFGADDHAQIETAIEYAREHEMVCIDRRIGRHPDHTYVGRYYVPKRYARIALAVTNLFEPAEEGAVPDFLTVQIPEHDEISIRVLPETGVTAVLGSDYSGEAKKSFLRLFMRRAKERGGLGLHAGSKRVTLETEAGERFSFTDYALIRIGDGRIDASGTLHELHLRVQGRPALYINGRRTDATVGNGMLEYTGAR